MIIYSDKISKEEKIAYSTFKSHLSKVNCCFLFYCQFSQSISLQDFIDKIKSVQVEVVYNAQDQTA